MDPLSYLTTLDPNFGAPEWVFFIAQIIVAVAGVYLGFLRPDAHPLRGAALRRLGYALLALGGVGTLVGALRLVPIAVFTLPMWITLVTLLEVVLAAYALYFAISVYPARLEALELANRGKSARRPAARPQPAAFQSNNTNGASSAATSRPAPTTSRREARRDRKRRSK